MNKETTLPSDGEHDLVWTLREKVALLFVSPLLSPPQVRGPWRKGCGIWNNLTDSVKNVGAPAGDLSLSITGIADGSPRKREGCSDGKVFPEIKNKRFITAKLETKCVRDTLQVSVEEGFWSCSRQRTRSWQCQVTTVTKGNGGHPGL